MNTILDALNSEELEVAKAIMKQLAEGGESDLLQSIYEQDYEEIPVSIDEFLENDRYLGQVYNNGKNIYPYWRNVLHNFFHNNPDKSFELALTGCLSGDTKIPLLSGETPTIREMYLRGKKKYEVYSFDIEKNEYTVGNTSDVIFTGIKSIYKITLDNGESVSVTSDHKFLTRDKHWRSIDRGLSVGDSLMPFLRVVDEYGYERVHQPQKDGTYYLDLTHQLVARSKYGYGGSVPKGKAIHHKNFNKRDNSPKNLLLVDKLLHILYHSHHMIEYLSENYDEWYEKTLEGLSRYREENPNALSERAKKMWDSLTPEEKSKRISKFREHCHDWKYTEKGREVAKKNLSIWNDKLSDHSSEEYKITCEKSKIGSQIRWSDPTQREEASIRMRDLNYDPAFQKKAQDARREKGYESESLRMARYNSDPENQRNNRRNKCLSQLNRLSSIPGVTPGNYREILESLGSKYKPTMSFILSEFGSFEEAMLLARSYNHKIVSIEYAGEMDVYDLTVERYHNFAVDSGCVVHNCIGSGKTTISAIVMIYLMYKTMCLKDPQKFYGLASNSPIAFVVMNLTLDLARDGLYSLIVEAIKLSPWFCERVDIRGKYDFSISFPKNIQLLCGSQTTHTIGRNVLGGVLDEMNFSNAPKGSKNSVMDMYRNLRRRLESRFLKQGRIPGILCLVSSKNTELDFLEQYIQSIKHLRTTWVIDEPIWNVKPPETYVGEKFKVAVGDKTKTSFIISTEDLSDLIEKGYKILDVPIEYKVAFEQDINLALCDIAGITAVSTSKLIPYAGRIDVCFDKSRKAPFYTEEFHMGLDSVDDIRDFLDDLSILKRDLNKPRFAHIDIGLKGDRLGLTIVHSSKEITVERYTPTGAIDKISENVYDIDLMLGIKAIPGSEIPLYKVREFLLWLSSYIGYKFKKITYDGFQSADSIQLLQMSGLPAGLLSVDRTDVPYLNLRACILEQRLVGYYNSIVIEELRDLEYDRKAKKVDHPIVKYDGSPGSKDISDSLCGAVYNAQEFYSKQKGNHVTKNTNVNAAMSALQRLNNLRKAQIENDDWILRD